MISNDEAMSEDMVPASRLRPRYPPLLRPSLDEHPRRSGPPAATQRSGLVLVLGVGRCAFRPPRVVLFYALRL